MTTRRLSIDIIPLVLVNRMTTCGIDKLLSRVKDNLKLADLSMGSVSSVTSLTKLKEKIALPSAKES